jgi:hypothetical protein
VALHETLPLGRASALMALSYNSIDSKNSFVETILGLFLTANSIDSRNVFGGASVEASASELLIQKIKIHAFNLMKKPSVLLALLPLDTFNIFGRAQQYA